MKLCSINISAWETCAADGLDCRLAARQCVQKAEEIRGRKGNGSLSSHHRSHAADAGEIATRGRAVQRLAKVQIDTTTWMLHHRLLKTERCGRRRALAQTKYLSRLNGALKILFFELLKDHQLIETVPPWYSLTQLKPLYQNNMKWRPIGMYQCMQTTQRCELRE